MTSELNKVKILRDKTNAGIMDIKNAIAEAGGDIDKAIEILRKKGIDIASKKSSRTAKEGVIASYIHMNGKIGVLLEVNCETDFVARNEEFRNFVKDITMQIAAANPTYIKKEDIPKKVLDKETEDLSSFYQQVCLLEQPFIKDPNVLIKDLLTSLIAKTGENIVIKRFIRYQLGESS